MGTPDVKYDFAPYDCKPDGWDDFVERLLNAAAKRADDRGYSLVNTVGALCVGCKRHGYPVGPLGGKFWRLRDRDGYVVQDDGVTRSAIVHQYDRFDPELNGLVSKLNCRGCWPPKPGDP